MVLITLMVPHRRAYRYNLNENSIAQETIVAPFTFQIRRSLEELEQMREEARQNVPPVLVFNEEIEVRQTVRLDTLFQMLNSLPAESENDSIATSTFQQYAPEATGESLFYIFADEVRGRSDERKLALSTQRIDSLQNATERVVAHYFSIGVIESKDPVQEMAGSLEWVKVILGEEEIDQRLSVVIDMDQAMDSMANMLRENLPAADERLVKGGFEISSAVLEPNLILDMDRTELVLMAEGWPTERWLVTNDQEGHLRPTFSDIFPTAIVVEVETMRVKAVENAPNAEDLLARVEAL